MSKCIEHNQKGVGLGYGSMSHKGRTRPMHRIAYCFARGIPLEYIEGAVVRHTCDNARCINPQHLVIGTHQDNVDDRNSRNRQAKGQAFKQAKLTPLNIKFIREHYVKYSSTHGTTAFAKLFNVSSTLIRSIVIGVAWKHI